METRASYVLVGSFVMACLLGLTIAMLWLAGSQYRQEFAYYRTVFTGGVIGLGTGTTVRFNGIDVGSIAELAFDPANPSSQWTISFSTTCPANSVICEPDPVVGGPPPPATR